MIYYIVDLGLRSFEEGYLTILDEKQFEESLNFNLDIAVDEGEVDEAEASLIVEHFNELDEVEEEINGFRFGKTNSTPEETKKEYGIAVEDTCSKDTCSKDTCSNDACQNDIKINDEEQSLLCDVNVKTWYKETFPTDPAGETLNDNTTFEDIFEALDSRKGNIYALIGGDSDSLIRERVFEKLAELIDADYKYVYDQWLLSNEDEEVVINDVDCKDEALRFKLGETVMTSGVNATMKENPAFDKEVKKSFARYINGDWGELCEEDKAMNEEAIKTGDDRIFAKYDTCEGPIYIITEWDRSVTTILFADEY